MWLQLISVVAGVVMILFGANYLTEGAAALAARFKIPQLIIGLTVVAFGTSAPELSAMSIPSREPMEMLNDIRSFCYGSSKKQLDQIVNMMAMIQMLQLMNQPEDRKEDAYE